MMENKIEAKPFIWQFERLRRNSVAEVINGNLNLVVHTLLGDTEFWLDALSIPFDPEEIPDIFEGFEISGFGEWVNREDLIGIKGAGMEYNFVLSPLGHWNMNSGNEGRQYNTKFTQTLNDFLSDLSRAGIEATFKKEWLDKNQLK